MTVLDEMRETEHQGFLFSLLCRCADQARWRVSCRGRGALTSSFDRKALLGLETRARRAGRETSDSRARLGRALD